MQKTTNLTLVGGLTWTVLVAVAFPFAPLFTGGDGLIALVVVIAESARRAPVTPNQGVAAGNVELF